MDSSFLESTQQLGYNYLASKYNGLNRKSRWMNMKPRLSDIGEETAEKICNLLGISSDEAHEICIIDEKRNDMLIMLHYIQPSSNVNHVKGLIINIAKMEICCPNFPHSPEVIMKVGADSNDFFQKIADFSRDSDENSRVISQMLLEGTLIRLFKSSKEWNLSTNRKIDGRQSKFISQSTMEELFVSIIANNSRIKRFEQLFPLFDEHLDVNVCYMFVLCHPENKVVCQIQEPRLWLVAAYHINNKEWLNLNIYDNEEWKKASNFQITTAP